MVAKLKPDWAGEDLLARLVNGLIQTKPLYAVMKRQARRVLIKTAEQKGVPWRQTCEQLAAIDTESLLSQVSNPTVTYPDYYQVPFHAYDQGNLCWQAAYEAAPATYAMALRVWPKESLTWQAAQARLRGSFHQVLAEHGPEAVQDILDIGCSVGISTVTLHRFYQGRQSQPVRTVGLDLSPYMLAVAKLQDQQQDIAQWLHAPAEATGLPDNAFDLITLQFVVHELPRQATQAIFKEVLRLLRPQGALALVDNNPRSPVIQNLPPVLFTLMKSTEPWSDDYYTFDLERALSQIGFDPPVTVASDPRHRTIVARKPTA
ncbi:2-methyl-6-phytyl-1,4-hydroquinone methyltransferase [Halomicronema hongdechloris C2206]|uniref:2-methyl-6-phytyl-1,4-hydroquinone methyltransferase n=1 Tax=Halomicronema hongdechloris C2206 TaxID=1641165 RepID=A0A1Z3HP31_9CYAN|nr:class I SAM-dependent methyltransferase [Halomicronema hongdechloris]ASC72022.1 2-methyl-6-phytyl-1,4-hydroquinone methyltransferase [Halomicronema hongdechloris C2206]